MQGKPPNGFSSALGRTACTCQEPKHRKRLIVITGGPGAGKTTVTKLAQQILCHHIAFVPEAASVVFGGGFWREESYYARQAAQRAIYHVQKEMESFVAHTPSLAAGICDRGTIDSSAYWPGTETSFWASIKSTKQQELSRYAAVIHLQTPTATIGYNHENPIRIENAEKAAHIDKLLLNVWRSHPNRIVIESNLDFMAKARAAIEAIQGVLPKCCNLPPAKAK